MPRASKGTFLVFMVLLLMGIVATQETRFTRVSAKTDLRIIQQQVRMVVEERTMQATMSDRPDTVQPPMETDPVFSPEFSSFPSDSSELPDSSESPELTADSVAPSLPDKVYINWFGGWISLYRRDGQLFLRLFKAPTAQDL